MAPKKEWEVRAEATDPATDSELQRLALHQLRHGGLCLAAKKEPTTRNVLGERAACAASNLKPDWEGSGVDIVLFWKDLPGLNIR